MEDDDSYPNARVQFIQALRKHLALKLNVFLSPEKVEEVFIDTLRELGGARACIALVEFADAG